MKRLSWLLILTMLLSACLLPASAEGLTLSQAPMLEEKVTAGELPPVEERLPEVPRISKEMTDEDLDQQIGVYGGTLRLVTSVVNWDADVFVGNNEALLTCESTTSANITPNIVESYEANDDNTVFTLKLRKGLKWSDGEPVTMEDFLFTYNNVILNEELTPAVAAYMCDGGVAGNQPYTMTAVDDTTFTISFNESYGGFPLHLSIVGWKGYTDMLKPAHYLKQFHKDFAEECHGSLEAYYEFLAPFGAAMGYDDVTAEGAWTYIFNQIDMVNWELTDPTDALTTVQFAGLIDTNFPVLYPWVMVSSENGVTTWERNPYYFKTDAEGNQLPYIDRVTSTLVEDMEMVQMSIVTGAVDYARESGNISNISMYKENEETAHLTTRLAPEIVNTSIGINFNYGMNPDGSVKDDDESKAWQEAVNSPEFLRALEISLDGEELAETVYKGFASPNPWFDCTHDIEGANAMLDEAGFADIDGDGYRETPSGLKLAWQLWNDSYLPDYVPSAELWVEYWREIGLKVDIYTTENTLLRTSSEANDVPMQILNQSSTQLWHYIQFGNRTNVLWNNWRTAGGMTGTLPEGEYAVPPEGYVKQLELIDSLLIVSPEEAVNEVVPEIMENCKEFHWIIEPPIDVMTCSVANADLGNVPDGGNGIAGNFSMEQFFYTNPEEH